MNVREALKMAYSLLSEAKIPEAARESEVLLFSYLHCGREELYKEPERKLTVEEEEGYKAWVERRRLGEPVTYITGKREFWSVELEIEKGVFIPRPETELLVEEVLKEAEKFSQDLFILEIGVGSGAISIALAKELRGAKIVATDVSPRALAVAAKNIKNHSLQDRISLVRCYLFPPLAGRFDVIVSNPPYVSWQEYVLLPPEIKNYEPPEALLADDGGIAVHRRIIVAAPMYLKDRGFLFLEMGFGQGEALVKIIEQTGQFADIEVKKDLRGIERIIKAHKTG